MLKVEKITLYVFDGLQSVCVLRRKTLKHNNIHKITTRKASNLNLKQTNSMLQIKTIVQNKFTKIQITSPNGKENMPATLHQDKQQLTGHFN